MMPEKKKQHYLPKVYMRQFANGDKKINICDINDFKRINNVPYKNQCYENYYYGSDKIWENKLGELETSWGKIFTNFLNDNTYYPTLSEIVLIKQFALYQRMRTLANNEHFKAVKLDLYDNIMDIELKQNGIDYTEDHAIYLKNHLEKYDDKITQVSLEIAQKIENEKLIDDLSFLVINYDTIQELIISDNPIVIINRFDKHITGLTCMGVVIFFPITPHKLMVIYDSKMYPKYKMMQVINSSNEEEVRDLNIFQVINAEKVLLFYGETQIDYLMNELSKYKKNRNDNKEKEKVNSFGGADNKLLVVSNKLSQYDCLLSFCKLPTFVSKIPNDCREAAPREYDVEWENKFIYKEKNMAQLMNKSKKEMGIDKKIGLNDKEIRKGCRKMREFAQYYWKSNY